MEDHKDEDDISRRIRELRKEVYGDGESGADPEKGAEFTRLLQNEFQIDRNQKGMIDEDPVLVSHMESARRRLMDQERAMAQLPKASELQRKYVAVLGRSSKILRDLTDKMDFEAQDVEKTFALANALRKVAQGETPHRFPPPSAGPCAQWLHASKVAEASAGAYEALYKDLVKFRNDMSAVRREFEEVADGLTRLVDDGNTHRQLMREMLATIPAKVVEVSAEPLGSAGEDMLANPLLPEEQKADEEGPAAAGQ